MKFVCAGCKATLRRHYDQGPSAAEFMARPGYQDENGVNHIVVACLRCGTLHDTIGSLMGLMNPFGSALKTVGSITPTQLAAAINESGDPSQSRHIAKRDYAVNDEMLDVLVAKKVLGAAFGR